MAIILNQDQQDLITIHHIHVHTEKKLHMLVKVLEENHKHGFFFRLFRRKCKICTALKKVTHG